MGDKLVKFYDEADKLGSIKAKMRLAVLTNISSIKAHTEPDSPENIQKFEKAMQELRKEF